jgi:hypothetical protein
MGGDGLAYDRARRGKEEGRGWGQGEQDALKWYNPALESISALLARMRSAALGAPLGRAQGLSLLFNRSELFLVPVMPLWRIRF